MGVTSAVNQSAEAERNGRVRTMRIKESVFYNERIRTDRIGLVQVLLVDGSTFTVGPDSDLVIDEFVYNPQSGAGKLVATFGKGVARFVGGRLSKEKGGVTINTRQGTVGIRGGMATFFEDGGQSVYSLLYGNQLSFQGQSGGNQLVYRSGFSVFAQGGQGTVGRTPADLTKRIVGLLSGQPGQNGGSSNKPKAGQFQAFSSLNSGLKPKYFSPIPKPVLHADPKRPLEGRFNLQDANNSFLLSTKTYGYQPYPGGGL
ncbi:FecR domain-containing protein [Stappia sp. F7233]|uniref:FecR domain-containing protein n=1 Tax=Stappia albiluteola TaxID=2758565 RepID=A0A839AGI7_9HYPH|nr:FecR domain-containing protein [Stappia albiluteola]MBA5778206.1 FecR domain-containing protein [Stappia albiluteola]